MKGIGIVGVLLIPTPHPIVPTDCKPQGRSKHPRNENAKTYDMNKAAEKFKPANPRPGIWSGRRAKVEETAATSTTMINIGRREAPAYRPFRPVAVHPFEGERDKRLAGLRVW